MVLPFDDDASRIRPSNTKEGNATSRLTRSTGRPDRATTRYGTSSARVGSSSTSTAATRAATCSPWAGVSSSMPSCSWLATPSSSRVAPWGPTHRGATRAHIPARLLPVPVRCGGRAPPCEVEDAARLVRERRPFDLTYYPRQGRGVPRAQEGGGGCHGKLGARTTGAHEVPRHQGVTPRVGQWRSQGRRQCHLPHARGNITWCYLVAGQRRFSEKADRPAVEHREGWRRFSM